MENSFEEIYNFLRLYVILKINKLFITLWYRTSNISWC